ncbi:MAG TPA: hypothetical protein VFO40_22700 [Chthoniobacterales bacterium]|nr:hypothetical protein [Chthoniobacterales bacterium]
MFPRFRLIAVISLLLASLPEANALLWKSRDANCSVDLPEGDPQIQPWSVMSPADPTGLTGAHRKDFSAYVYLGMVTEDDPHFKLDEKSIDELQKRFFAPGLGFRHTIEAINHHGVAGFRLTGTHRFNATKYSVVLDMFESNGKVYEVAGLSKEEINPLKDPDIRSFMDSFRLLGK